MINTVVVKNKVSHISKKIERRLNVTCDINVILDSELDDIGMSEYKDEAKWWVFELDTINHQYVINQINYLNDWLKKYNKKHKTRFICL